MALLLIVPAAVAVTLTVIAGADPTGREARVKERVVACWLKFQASPEALTNVTPAGSISVTVTEVAVLGPALITLIV